jgi:hypothetical protein
VTLVKGAQSSERDRAADRRRRADGPDPDD